MGKRTLALLFSVLAIVAFGSVVNAYCGDRVCEAGEEWCAPDCLSPYGAFCTLSAYPKHVPLGGQSEITVRYFNTFYPVGFAAVNCGNGLVMYAWNCGGRTGECFTSCRYYYPGVYTVTAFAGGVSCRPTQVLAGQPPQPTPTPTPTVTPRPSPTPTPRYRNPRCAVETNPEYVYGSGVSNIKTPYYDLDKAPGAATIICGNGEIVYGSCEGNAAAGNCVGSCAYAAPPRYPWAYSVDAVVGGVQCAAGTVSLLQGMPTPTATPTASPRGTLVVKVFREDGVRPFWGAVVRVPGRGDFRTGYDGVVEVAELDAGDYTLTVSADGFETQRASARVAGGETTRVTIVMREAAAGCAVSAVPSNLREGEASSVSVSYFNLPAVPESVNVNCGNSRATTAQCSGGYSGNCVGGSCAYPAQGVYYLSASAAGVACRGASVSVSRGAPQTGALLVRVTDCGNGGAVRGARVELTQQTVPRPTPRGVYYANEYGEVLASDLPAGDYVAVVSKEGYETQRASGRVEAGRTSTLSVCLEPSGGGGAASCAVSIVPSLLKVNEAGSASVDYYSLPADPESVRVECGNGAATNAQCNGANGTGRCVSGSCTYSSVGVYYLTAATAGVQCSQATARVTERGGDALSLQALETDKQGYGGERACFALLLRNSGGGRGVVEIDAGAWPSNDWKTSFSSTRKFVVVPHELKNIDFCVEIPEAASGTYAYAVNARSEINDAAASVTLRAFGSSDFSLDYAGCLGVEADSGWATRVLRLTNNAADGNYEIEFGTNELGAEADSVYAFKKGETRDVAIRLSTEGLESKNYYFDFMLKKKTGGGSLATVFQRTICVRPSGAGAGAVTLSPSSLTVERGATQTATLTIQNQGSGTTRFYVSALKKTGLSIAVAPQYLTLDAGSEGAAEIKITADVDAALGPVSVPVRVYNSASGGGYYSDYNVEFDCGNGETRSAQCGYGDGSCSVSCPYASTGSYAPRALLRGNSCSSTVRVLDYYPSNSIVLRAETPFIPTSGASVIRVDYYSLTGGGGSNAPVITNVENDARDTSADIFWDTDKGSNSRVDYAYANHSNYRTETRSGYVTQHEVTITGLASNTLYVYNVTSCDIDGRCSTDGEYGLQTENSTLGFYAGRQKAQSAQSVLYFDDVRTIRINCGNGQTQTTTCSGSGGSCSASCYYSSTGTFDVTASVDGSSPTVYNTRVVVGRTDNEICYLTSDPQTIRDGETSAVKMNYYRIPSDGGYYEYEYEGLVDSQTLLVNVVAVQPTGGLQQQPLVSQRLEIDAKTIRAAPGTRTAAPVTIRNKNYYDVASLLVYADSLPQGVTAKTLSPFALAAGDEKTLALEFEVGDVAAGDYEIALHAESAIAEAPVKRVTLQVRGAIGEAAASVSEPTTSVKRDDAAARFEIALNFTVKNDADAPKTLSAAIEGLPANWTYGVTPLGGATLAANESRAFAATIFAPLAAFDEYKEYPATLAVSDEAGKTKRVPLAINKGGASVLAGFFTALGGDYGLFALLVIIIAAGAALLYYAGVKTKQAGAAKAAKETKATRKENAGKEEKTREGKQTREGKR